MIPWKSGHRAGEALPARPGGQALTRLRAALTVESSGLAGLWSRCSLKSANTQVALEEEWGDWLVSQRQAWLTAVHCGGSRDMHENSRLCLQVDAAINHYIEARFAAFLIYAI